VLIATGQKEGHFMTWGNGNAAIAEPSQPTTAPFSVEERDRRLAVWDEAKKVLEAAKTSEMEARKLVADYCFPNAREGTNRIELNNGYSLKCVAKLNHKIARRTIKSTRSKKKRRSLGTKERS
jgi:hypothetical protein